MANKKESNNLTLSVIKKQAKQNNQTDTHVFPDGKELKFYPVFPPKKVKELQKDMQSIIQEIEEMNKISPEDKQIEVTEEYLYNLVNFLCVKHFTGLKRSFGNGLIKTIDAMNALADTDYYKIMIDDMFDQREIRKVINSLGEIYATFEFMNHLAIGAKTKFDNLKLQNPDIIQNLENLDK